ncbi:putative membrane protease [Escherichia coli]|nr:putative membrane protease [Escherichia coli]
MKAPVSLTSFRPQKSLAIAIGVLAVVVLPFSRITPLMKVNAAFCCATEKS